MIPPPDKISEVSASTVRQKLASDRWRIIENDFPINDTISNQLKFLANYTISASPSHNTQPWICRIVDDAIELYVDKTRALPIADPNCRELIIGCGAALFNLRIAIRYFGYRDIVEMFPEGVNSNLLARISLGSKRIVKLEEKLLFRAMTKRSLDGNLFDDRPLPDSSILELESAACSEGSWLQIMTEVIPKTNRQAVINLIAESDRLQMAEPLSLQESAHWIHDSGNLAPLVSLAVRSLNLSKSRPLKDCELASAVPVVMLINSEDDNHQAWLETGEALAHLLLRARLDDIGVTFFNRPIKIPHLRSRLRKLFPDGGYPQIMLGLGYVKEVEAAFTGSTNKITREVAHRVTSTPARLR